MNMKTTQPPRTRKLLRLSALLVVAALFLPGCGTPQYYRISDPLSNEVYYTQKVEHPKDMPNTARFVDKKSGRTIQLDRMKIDALSKTEWETESGLKADQK
jgi:hypothetical protein